MVYNHKYSWPEYSSATANDLHLSFIIHADTYYSPRREYM